MGSGKLARRILAHKYLALAFRLFVGGVFIYASINKISYTGEFAESIASYQIVPYWAVNSLAVIISWTELICGILLVAGIRSKSAVAMIAIMLALFTAVISITLIREIPIGCGCFSSTEDPMTWETVARDIVWLAMAIHVYFFDSALQLEKIIFTRISEISHAVHSHLPDADFAAPVRPVVPEQQRATRKIQGQR